MPRAVAFAMMACTISGAICSLDVEFIEFTSGCISLIIIRRNLELRNSLRPADKAPDLSARRSLSIPLPAIFENLSLNQFVPYALYRIKDARGPTTLRADRLLRLGGDRLRIAQGSEYNQTRISLIAIRILPEMARKPDRLGEFITRRPTREDLAVPLDGRHTVAISIENCCADRAPVKRGIFAQRPLVIGSRV